MPISGLALSACAVIYFTSAVLSGLSGFGFSALGALSMWFLPPQFAVSMLMSASLITQIYSLKATLKARPAMKINHMTPFLFMRQIVPYVVGGTLGLYVGIQLLAMFSANLVCCILGLFLISYTTYCLKKPSSLQIKTGSSPQWSGVIGFFSTMIGAFCGGPGIVLMAWLQLRAVPKDLARAIAQPFIIFMQIIGLAIFVLKSPLVFSEGFFICLAILLPIALLGSEIGVKIYAKTSEFNYRQIIMFLLLGSGVALTIKALV